MDTNLRMEVWKSQKIKVKNPYTISNLLPKSKLNVFPPDIPYEQIGICEAECSKIATAIMESIAEQPNKTVNIQDVIKDTGLTVEKVKKVFYYLLLDGYLKATYIAYHKKCNKPISQMQNYAFELSDLDGINKSCVYCNNDIEAEEIENRILFWGKDANIKW